MNRLLVWFRRYRWPITIGAGGVVAYTAYTSAQQRVAAAQAAQAAATAPANPAAPLSPEQTAALIGQGASIATSAQAPLVDLASGGLSVAGAAASGAQALSQVALGNLGGAVGIIGDALGQVVGTLPSFAPAAGIAPQPTQPVTAPAPTPAPTPEGGTSSTTGGPTPGKTLTGYRVLVSAGKIIGYQVASNGSMVPKTLSFGAASSAPVSRHTAGGRVYWRTEAGGYKGLSYVVGLSTPTTAWRIVRVYSDGSTSPIAQTGA